MLLENYISTGQHAQVVLALVFATMKHHGQARKYTNEPYVNHCKEVADILLTVTGNPNIIMAGLLHDTVEDTRTTFEEIEKHFGFDVAKLVYEVTDVSKPSDGNRAVRKELDRQHIGKASRQGQLIKLADMISNTKSITQHDPNFSVVYLKEMRRVLELIDPTLPLYSTAKELIGE